MPQGHAPVGGRGRFAPRQGRGLPRHPPCVHTARPARPRTNTMHGGGNKCHGQGVLVPVAPPRPLSRPPLQVGRPGHRRALGLERWAARQIEMAKRSRAAAAAKAQRY